MERPCLVCADATDNHTNIINFSTPPTWLYQTSDRVAFPDDPLGETWGYEQGNALRDASGKTFGEWGYEQGKALRDASGKTFGELCCRVNHGRSSNRSASLTAAGEYYGRLLAWYTDGGFTDEYGVRHESGHAYNISTWE